MQPPLLFLFSPNYPAPIGAGPQSHDHSARDLANSSRPLGVSSGLLKAVQNFFLIVGYHMDTSRFSRLLSYCSTLTLCPVFLCRAWLLICIQIVYIQQDFDLELLKSKYLDIPPF